MSFQRLAILPRKADFSCFWNHPGLESRLTFQEKPVLDGEYDIADVQRQTGALGASISGSKRMVPDTGHLMYLEHPDAFAKLVAQFISGAKL